MRTRLPAPTVLTPGTEALAKYDVIVGWDTEYVERVAPNGEQYNEIVSYQFSAVWRERGSYWFIEGIIYPPTGTRLSLSVLAGHILRACGIGYRRAAKCHVLLVAHFGVAEWAAMRDRERLAREHLNDIRGVPVSFRSFTHDLEGYEPNFGCPKKFML